MTILALLTLLQAVALPAASAEPLPAAAQEPEHQLSISDDARIELTAHWEPAGKSLYGLLRKLPALREPKPAELRRSYGAEDFRPFLPAAPVALGAVWQVPHDASLKLLSQFHPGVMTPLMSFGEVPGTHATLRAVSADTYEILLRAHAVFTLDDGVVLKPAQFEGRLIIGRKDGAVRSFSFALPPRDTNMDVNVPIKDEAPVEGFISMQADIGFVPRMELSSGDAPVTAWVNEIPLEDARLALRRAFYSFAGLDWLPFEEAVAASRAQKKPLHLVLLFGCLDDDSC